MPSQTPKQIKDGQNFTAGRRLCAAVITAAAIAVATITLQAPLPAAAQNQVTLKLRPEADNDVFKGCFKKDPNGQKFDYDIENRMGTEMYLDCDGDQRPYHFGPGEMRYESYASIFDLAPPPRYFSLDRTSPRVACVAEPPELIRLKCINHHH
ncbi:hypothetical protein C2845_PM13G09680 [Panicum miliaceum]|uniref:Uncharacterized protein n=1 Tax=Panicum miliaceum TaxID=4540 RepID=A0A3L6RKI2_PANMI|nr:hypothetical protein C2845_PM13G09680 [Panicum miliaceum]